MQSHHLLLIAYEFLEYPPYFHHQKFGIKTISPAKIISIKNHSVKGVVFGVWNLIRGDRTSKLFSKAYAKITSNYGSTTATWSRQWVLG
jgi:hypothetical protein